MSAHDSANPLPPLPIARRRGGGFRPTLFGARAAPEVPHCARAISLVMAAIGLVLVAQGLWMPAKARLAQILLERAFEQTIATGDNVKPWSWADTWPIARIEVKRIGANAIVLHGSSGQALAFGPGHIETTAQAGGNGTAVYSAHRDTHFAFLKEVVVGDDIDVTRRDGTLYRYRVTHFSVVHWDRSGIDPFAEGHNLVLVTCWPLTERFPGPMRYLVHANLVVQEPAANPAHSREGANPEETGSPPARERAEEARAKIKAR